MVLGGAGGRHAGEASYTAAELMQLHVWVEVPGPRMSGGGYLVLTCLRGRGGVGIWNFHVWGVPGPCIKSGGGVPGPCMSGGVRVVPGTCVSGRHLAE